MPSQLELAAEQSAVSAAVRAEMDQAGARLERQRAELQRLRTNNRDTQRALKRAAVEWDGMFETADERLRHDVYLAWAKNTPAADKARHPLPAAWTAGPEFADSLYGLHGARAGRQSAQDHSGDPDRGSGAQRGAGNPSAAGEQRARDSAQVRREDGARCFRAAVERNVAAARRLHFWRLPDGTIELSRIVVHDDYQALIRSP